jgi:hypothetical protein
VKKEEIIEILVDDYHEDLKELKNMKKDELMEMLENYRDTSDFHPNESFEDFMEHENME